MMSARASARVLPPKATSPRLGTRTRPSASTVSTFAASAFPPYSRLNTSPGPRRYVAGSTGPASVGREPADGEAPPSPGGMVTPSGSVRSTSSPEVWARADPQARASAAAAPRHAPKNDPGLRGPLLEDVD